MEVSPLAKFAPWWLAAALTVGVCAAQSINPLPGQPPLGGNLPQAQPQQQAPAEKPENTAATVLSLEGQVSVIKDPGPREEPWALNAGDSVAQRQVIVTGSDGHALFQVNDGSTFEVFPDSRVTFRQNPSWSDLLDLWLGKIRVHIQKWGGQPNINRIHTPTAVISVRGTTFEVINDEEDTTTVAVSEGIVDVRHRLIMQAEPRTLEAGDEIRVYKNIPLAKSKIDKGSIAKRILDAAGDVLYTVMSRSGGSVTGLPGGSAGGAAGGGGTTLPGDTQAPEPPPPPPPPPPAPGDASGGPAPPPPPGI
jgi:hypothetical protein